MTFETLSINLKQAGMRLTPQRLAVCKLLCESDTHPTAAAIYEEIRQQYPSLSLMTVYNTLNTLVDLGVVNVLGHAGDDMVHYDANTTPHVHLACISCHEIEDITSLQVESLEAEISRISSYKLLGARMLYYGLCPTCQTSTTN